MLTKRSLVRVLPEEADSSDFELFELPVNSRRPGFGGNGPFVGDLAFSKRTAVAAERAEWVTWCPAGASLSHSPSWPALSVNCDLLIWMVLAGARSHLPLRGPQVVPFLAEGLRQSRPGRLAYLHREAGQA